MELQAPPALRTPLVTLKGYAALHSAGGLADEASTDDAMRRIKQEANRMGRLVEDLLQTHKDLDYLVGTAVMAEAAVKDRGLQRPCHQIGRGGKADGPARVWLLHAGNAGGEIHQPAVAVGVRHDDCIEVGRAPQGADIGPGMDLVAAAQQAAQGHKGGVVAVGWSYVFDKYQQAQKLNPPPPLTCLMHTQLQTSGAPYGQ